MPGFSYGHLCSGVHSCARFFLQALGIQTQVVILVQKVSLPMSLLLHCWDLHFQGDPGHSDDGGFINLNFRKQHIAL